MNNEIYPIAKLGDSILIINKTDLPYIGEERALEVKCVKADLHDRKIDAPIELEKHLKFNPWEEITEEDERNVFLQILNTKFSDDDILNKIMEPLAENLVRP